ncbi:fatty acid phospholipid synthesis protein PlsX [Lactobacillus psittaci DSM 15354]|uniref:Phosphate acyltransferase n=2 Tax=Lactobacillus psittaci TaxID=116089 RepID=A0A0R1S511_9LACO|nr:fatty acid phospholipid synthesis protein PlsX [Lactobacillus psittaci DSM 15354]
MNSMRRIAIDAMGGENAPEAIIKAVLRAKKELKETQFLLFGNKEEISKYLPSEELDNQIEIINTSEIISDEDEPVRAIRRKKDSSLVVAANYVKTGKADGLLSLGNTGALLAAGIFIVGRIKGVERPGLMPTLPVKNSDNGFNMIDVGANAQAKPEYLVKWAQMASFYAEKVRGIKNPKVALLNNGAEYDKGDDLHKNVYQLLQAEPINFIGNIEGNQLLSGMADVVVTDGFTGNAVLKNIEGTSSTILHLIKDALINGSFITKIGALLIKGALKSIKSKFDTAKYGGAVLLGLKSPVVKTHGRSDQRAIYYTLIQIDKMIEEDLTSVFTAEFSKNDDK